MIVVAVTATAAPCSSTAASRSAGSPIMAYRSACTRARLSATVARVGSPGATNSAALQDPLSLVEVKQGRHAPRSRCAGIAVVVEEIRVIGRGDQGRGVEAAGGVEHGRIA